MDDSDDDDIKRAIALSLQDLTPAKPSKHDAITIDDSDDDDLNDLTESPVHGAKAGKRRASTTASPTKAGVKRKVQTVDLVDSDTDDDLDHTPELWQQSTKAHATAKAGQQTKHAESAGQPGLKEVSIGTSSSSTRATASVSEAPSTETHTQSAPPPAFTGLAGLNRAQMEAERLARLAARTGKREREISPPALARPAKAMKSESEAVTTTSAAPALKDTSSAPESTSSSTPATKPVQPVTKMSDQSSAFTGTSSDSGILKPSSSPSVISADISSTVSRATSTSTSLAYPEGRLLKTWAFKQPRANDIKIEEVLERRTLSLALLSAFQVDFAWLFTKVDTKRTNFQFVLHAPDESSRKAGKEDLESLGPNVKAHFPPSAGGCMHSKLMLLAHPDKLRVVIPSANLVPYDWGETGFMENTIWLIDLPRLPPTTRKEETPFFSELVHFLTRQGLSKTFLDSLGAFDWTATKRYAFVHTISGPSMGASLARTGSPGLSSAVKRLGLSPSEGDVEIDFAASSVGALTEQQLSLLTKACAGKLVVPPASVPDPPPFKEENFRLYFPSLQYVRDSIPGINGGGTIWLSRDHVKRNTFPRDVLREFKSVRPGMLSHCKLLFARGPGVAWVYAGSANCSESAWGRISKGNKGAEKGRVKVQARNWEAGVLIPVLKPGVTENNTSNKSEHDGGSDSETESEDGDDTTPEFSVFDNTIKVFHVPAPKLTGEPWYCNEHGHGH